MASLGVREVVTKDSVSCVPGARRILRQRQDRDTLYACVYQLLMICGKFSPDWMIPGGRCGRPGKTFKNEAEPELASLGCDGRGAFGLRDLFAG
jgi:hypothetical protein